MKKTRKLTKHGAILCLTISVLGMVGSLTPAQAKSHITCAEAVAELWGQARVSLVEDPKFVGNMDGLGAGPLAGTYKCRTAYILGPSQPFREITSNYWGQAKPILRAKKLCALVGKRADGSFSIQSQLEGSAIHPLCRFS